jgi:hypothetical protein
MKLYITAVCTTIHTPSATRTSTCYIFPPTALHPEVPKVTLSIGFGVNSKIEVDLKDCSSDAVADALHKLSTQVRKQGKSS